jgi:tetratricopeptide (TPR) repeat protein
MMKVLLRGILFWCLLFCTTAALADEPHPVSLWLPDQNWKFEIDLKGFNIDDFQYGPDFDAISLWAAREDSLMLLTLFIEPTLEKVTCNQRRDLFLKHSKAESPFPMIDITQYDRLGISFVKFTDDASNASLELRQYNVFAFMVRNDYWITVHISCVNQKPEDEKAIDQTMATINMVNGYQANAEDYLGFGSIAYLRENYKHAIDYYEKCLALEKQIKLLPREHWLVMVDNLGMSYGISGDRQNARKIFEYGLSVEPEYPMFFYNNACTFAEENQLDSAIVYLSKAYKYEPKMIPGEKIPDPLQDSSFENFRDDKTLKDFLLKIGKLSQ